MSGAKKLGSMRVFAVLNPNRYIKKSIKDGSLAIFDEEESANGQVSSISDASDEECHIEELALCNKVKFDEYVNVYNEMYEKLNETSDYLLEIGGITNTKKAMEIKNPLAKARGEHESSR